MFVLPAMDFELYITLSLVRSRSMHAMQCFPALVKSTLVFPLSTANGGSQTPFSRQRKVPRSASHVASSVWRDIHTRSPRFGCERPCAPNWMRFSQPPTSRRRISSNVCSAQLALLLYIYSLTVKCVRTVATVPTTLRVWTMCSSWFNAIHMIIVIVIVIITTSPARRRYWRKRVRYTHRTCIGKIRTTLAHFTCVPCNLPNNYSPFPTRTCI